MKQKKNIFPNNLTYEKALKLLRSLGLKPKEKSSTQKETEKPKKEVH
jgi:uncharacterized membrane protein